MTRAAKEGSGTPPVRASSMAHWIQLLGDALKLMLETQINSLSAALEWGWDGPDPVRGTRWSGKVEHRLVLPVCLPRPPQRQPHRGPGRATPLEMKKPQHALRRGARVVCAGQSAGPGPVALVEKPGGVPRWSFSGKLRIL